MLTVPAIRSLKRKAEPICPETAHAAVFWDAKANEENKPKIAFKDAKIQESHDELFIENSQAQFCDKWFFNARVFKLEH